MDIRTHNVKNVHACNQDNTKSLQSLLYKVFSIFIWLYKLLWREVEWIGSKGSPKKVMRTFFVRSKYLELFIFKSPLAPINFRPSLHSACCLLILSMKHARNWKRYLMIIMLLLFIYTIKCLSWRKNYHFSHLNDVTHLSTQAVFHLNQNYGLHYVSL